MILKPFSGKAECSPYTDIKMTELNRHINDLISDYEKTTSCNFFSNFREIEVPAGTYLIKTKEVASCLWYLSSGIGHVFFQKGEIKITQAFVFAHELFCIYSSSITGRPSFFSVQLLTDSVILSLDWDDWEELKEKYPVLKKAEQLLIACWLFTTEEASIQRFFTAKEKYFFLYKRHPRMIAEIPSVYLADYLGTSPETISRIRSKIKEGIDIPAIPPLEYLFEKRALKLGVK